MVVYIDAVLGALLELMTMQVGVGPEAKSCGGEGAASRFLSDGNTSSAKRKAPNDGGGGLCFLSIEDKLFLFEVAGQLVGSLPTAEQQLPYLEAVIRPQLQQLEVGCTLAQQLAVHRQRGGGVVEEERVLGDSIAHIVAAVAQVQYHTHYTPYTILTIHHTHYTPTVLERIQVCP
jgi:hypothetical protein